MNPDLALGGAAAVLFAAGASFLVLRRELIAMIIGLELMINAANLGIVRAALGRSDPEGLAVALLVIAVAAAEVVVGLALILAIRRHGKDPDSADLRSLFG